MNSINVYIPETLTYSKIGYLSGVYLRGNYSNGEIEPPLIVIDDKVEESLHENVIGEISTDFKPKNNKRDFWIFIRNDPFLIEVKTDEKEIRVEDLNLIFYNPSQIKKSYMLGYPNMGCEYFSRSMELFILRVQNGYKRKKNNYQHSSLPCYSQFFNYFNLFITLNNYLTCVLEKVNHFLFRLLDAKSFSVQQSVHRLKQINFLTKGLNNKDKLVTMRLLGALLTDIIFGVLSVYIITRWTTSVELLNYFESSTEMMANKVQKLLKWLSGAPAGLKLNQPLSETLAVFFSYHVYLWTLYLGVARPVLAVIIKLFVYVGLLGISLQIALLVDFLNIGVLHIHTFYIYAARLHMLQVSLLGSQWRGFRGRKWNPLKERVDARSEYRQRPLIKVLSAFGFTFVLFLMPTTTVYYSVFVMLRLLLLIMRGFVSFLLWAINSNPVYIAILYLCGSSYLKGNPYFELLTNESQVVNNSSIQLRLTIRSSSLSDSITATHSKEVFSKRPRLKIGYLCNSLIYANELL